MSSKRFRVGEEYINFFAEEVAVTQTRLFQRLNLIKQLGLANLVYPSATHTRGFHSLLTVHEVTKIISAIRQNDPTSSNIDEAEERAIRMAALIHDIGHIPFSHTLEDEHKVLHKDKHDGSRRLKLTLDLLKADLDDTLTGSYRSRTIALIDEALPILQSISGEKTTWKSDIIGNTICGDLLAYINEDAKWTGIEKRSGHYALYQYFMKKDDQLCIRLTKGGLRNDVVSAIMDILEMRYTLTERVIFHHAKAIASSMLARAAGLCELKDVTIAIQKCMGDEAFLDHLETLSEQQGGKARSLLTSLRSRRLYQRVFKVGPAGRDAWDGGRSEQTFFCALWRDNETVEKLLSSVEQSLDLPTGSLVLWCPDPNAGVKVAKAQVVWDAGEGLQGPDVLRNDRIKKQFPSVYARAAAIEDLYPHLWTFWIGIDRRFLSRAAQVVRELEARLDIPCDRLFRETYLYVRVPGFKDAEAQAQQIDLRLKPIVSQVHRTVAEQAAADGKVQADDQTIRSALQAALMPPHAPELDFSTKPTDQV